MHGSDHFPILIKPFDNQTNKTNTKNNNNKYLLDKANWEKFRENNIILNNLITNSENVNKEAANVRKILIKSANISIPKLNIKYNKKYNWWNKELDKLKIEEKLNWEQYFYLFIY